MNSRNRFLLFGILLLAIGAVMMNKARPRPTDAGSSSTATAVAATGAEQGLPRILCLGAGKCVPCKAMEPVREALRTEYMGRLNVQFCDVWNNPDCGEKHEIRLIPTTIFYDAAGKEVGRAEGYMSKEDILGRFGQLGVTL